MARARNTRFGGGYGGGRASRVNRQATPARMEETPARQTSPARRQPAPTRASTISVEQQAQQLNDSST